MSVVGILLAAGRSVRFGSEDKLLADLRDRPLIWHAATALADAGCDRLVAVTTQSSVANILKEYEIIQFDRPSLMQSDSLRAAISRAGDLDAEGALIALADMPLITVETLRRVLERGRMHGISAVTDGRRRMPPAYFHKGIFPELLKTDGDRGARSLIAQIATETCIEVPEEELIDVDELGDLERARSEFRRRET
ncbi:MAG: nucleotidyltransferase family protein [Pseudomonadota bacterium]